jgi:hypothetical protein
MNISYNTKNYLLLIGIKYENWNKEHQLTGTLNDVEALRVHFSDTEKAGYEIENIITLTESSATKKGIADALGAIALKMADNPQANLIVYYSGHAETESSDTFLLPYDFKVEEWKYNKLNLADCNPLMSNELALCLDEIKAKKMLIIMDCCHAENTAISKRTKSINFEGLANQLGYSLGASTKTKSLTNSVSKGKGCVLLTSCEADEESLDGKENGLFAEVLLESLNGKGNRKKDGWVRLTDLIDYVPSRVKELAEERHQHSQNPMFKRIENLSSEEFIICAYDILAHQTEESEVKSSNSYNSLIDEDRFQELFIQLDNKIDNHLKFQYNRLKREYSAGLKGINLLDFADRLKVFITQLSQLK